MPTKEEVQAAANQFVLKDARAAILYQMTGSALIQIQFFESFLARYIAAALRLAPDAALSEVERVTEKTEGMTLGALIWDLKKRANLTPEAATLLGEMCEERNWLAHRLVRENALDVLNQKKFDALVLRISDVELRARHLKGEFNRLFMEFATAQGFTEDDFNQYAIDFIRDTLTGAAGV